MIPFMGIGAGLQAANTLYQLGSGIVQSVKGSKIKPQRPTYKIPREIAQNQAMYRAQANSTRVPGQSIIENNIKAGSANAMRNVQNTARNTGDVLAAASQINSNQNQAFNNLGLQGAQMQMANKDRLASANETMAQYRNQAFDYNKNQPYLNQMARKNALIGSGAQNISGAFNSGANSAFNASLIENGGYYGNNETTPQNSGQAGNLASAFFSGRTAFPIGLGTAPPRTRLNRYGFKGLGI